MFERSSVADPQEAESAGTARNCPQRPAAVPEFRDFRLEYGSADDSIFGIRGDRILLILGGQVRPGGFRFLFIMLF